MKPPKFSGIYSITHIASGRRYVGSSKNIYNRWRDHKSRLNNDYHHCVYLQRAWNKYGKDAFAFEVLEQCFNNPVVLCAREQFWIDKYKPKIFNVTDRAEPAWGASKTPEQKVYMSQVMMGNKNGSGSHYHGKLKPEDVLQIATRYASGEDTSVIANDYSCSAPTVTRIASRKIWWTVELPDDVVQACQKRLKQRARGEKNANAKLSQEKAREIRKRGEIGERTTDLAKEYGVTPAAISSIKFGRSYKYLWDEDKPPGSNYEAGPLPA